ncbi:hypothetical protein [uncultured Ruegeria sp.]|uniref:hypothetical protein n=1 Tax=uncultured Ruegeria sp. TaxID=259304 RepID=UPI00262E9344|nr:hypothetical protein [uncultured Ruegeria sp.]
MKFSHLLLTTSLCAASATAAFAQSRPFNEVDSNNDGALTMDELVSVFGRRSAERIVARADRNSDGALTRAEVRASSSNDEGDDEEGSDRSRDEEDGDQSDEENDASESNESDEGDESDHSESDDGESDDRGESDDGASGDSGESDGEGGDSDEGDD